jgi:hypothetical protein
VSQDPYKLLEQVSSPRDLAEFVRALRKSLAESPEAWESLTLSTYLEAMSAWLIDASRSEGTTPHTILSRGPSWRTFANILLAASAYE